MSTVSLARRTPIWVRSLLCLPLLVLPLSCASKGGQTGDEFGSTAGQTGHIDESRIKVELVEGDVHVIGRAGAVPDGATVVIEDIDSGKSIEVEADEDGSFDAQIDGEVDGTYEIRVKGSSSIPAQLVGGPDAPPAVDAGEGPSPDPSNTQTPEPTPTTDPPTEPGTEPTIDPSIEPPPDPTTEPPEPGPMDAGTPEPEPITEESARAEFEAFVAERTSCSEDSECAIIMPECPLGCVAYVNTDGEAEASDLAEVLVDRLNQTGFGCDYDCAAPGEPACIEGQCGERPETTETDPQQLCEATEGTWVAGSCGDYLCGQMPLTDCAIGGCDCGADRNFGEAGCQEAAACSDELALTIEDDDFAYPTAPYLQCEVDMDCTHAINSCSQCCTYSAVNVDMATTYAENRAQACEGYQGGVCDCEAREISTACVDSQCVVVEEE